MYSPAFQPTSASVLSRALNSSVSFNNPLDVRTARTAHTFGTTQFPGVLVLHANYRGNDGIASVIEAAAVHLGCVQVTVTHRRGPPLFLAGIISQSDSALAMQFTLSSDVVRDAVFTLENDQVMYKTTHPRHRFSAGTTTIHKIKPNDDLMDMRDQFNAIGEIEWHVIGSSTFRLNGQEMKSNTFLPSHGLSGRKRTFTGPDGRPYRWDMPLYDQGLVLSRDDESRTEVARYSRGSLGMIGPKREPQLKIDPEVEHMLDLIVLTFVYMEKTRRDLDGETASVGDTYT